MISYSHVASILAYDPDTGVFTWKQTKGPRAKAGDVAGCLNDQGYWRVKIDGKHYRANRLAYLLMTGDWPAHEVDHENGIQSDNRWDNLRHATRSQNEVNKPFKGVRRKGNRYQARITHDGKRIDLGWYGSEAAAMTVYSKTAQRIRGERARAS